MFSYSPHILLHPTHVGTIITIGRYVPYQWLGEPPILPLRPPVPLCTFQSCMYLLPNPAKPHDVSNLFPKDPTDRAPIINNRRIPSNYPHAWSLIVEVAMVATLGKNTYNTQILVNIYTFWLG